MFLWELLRPLRNRKLWVVGLIACVAGFFWAAVHLDNAPLMFPFLVGAFVSRVMTHLSISVLRFRNKEVLFLVAASIYTAHQSGLWDFWAFLRPYQALVIAALTLVASAVGLVVVVLGWPFRRTGHFSKVNQPVR